MFKTVPLFVCDDCRLKISSQEDDYKLWIERHVALHEFPHKQVVFHEYMKYDLYSVSTQAQLQKLFESSLNNVRLKPDEEALLRSEVAREWNGPGWYTCNAKEVIRDPTQWWSIYQPWTRLLEAPERRIQEARAHLKMTQDEYSTLMLAIRAAGIAPP